MNQFNIISADEPTDPPLQWNSQPTSSHFRYRTSTTKTSTVVSSIMGKLNHHSIDNGDVKVHPLYFPFESNSESVPYPETNPIKSIDDEMDHLLKFFYSELDDDILDIDVHMIQDLLVVTPSLNFL